VLSVVTDHIHLSPDSAWATVVSTTDYYAFGLNMPGRTFQSEEYRYGFNGKEKDDEMKGSGNLYDFGARLYDPRLGRWLSVDPYETAYAFASPYNFALNTPIQAIDPDGYLVIFINGLRLWQGARDQYGPNIFGAQMGIQRQSFTSPDGLYNYWRTGVSDGQFEQNTFGRITDIAFAFMNRIQDYNSYFTSGSSYWNSQAVDREIEGARKAEQFHQMVQNGQIELANDETIKIVSHSQGGAHAHGFANRLLQYKDDNGNQLYNIEVIYNINPHQSSDIKPVSGVRTVTYQHFNDGISGTNAKFLGLPGLFLNGGSIIGEIPGAENIMRNIMGSGSDNPSVPAEGPAGNRSGHIVTDNDNFIFNIPSNQRGAVRIRQDRKGG
jgi:RHS repeat-associated protein